MKLSRRILLQIALAAGLVILLASGLTWRLVFTAAEQESQDHLADYVSERARVEEVKLRHVRENLEMIRGQFVQANLPPAPRVAPANQNQWDHYFELSADGAWRSRREFSDGRKWATLWAGKSAILTPELRTQIQRANLICNQAIKGWVDTFPSLYFVFPQNVNIGFDPRIPDWVWQTPADYDNTAIEAVRNAAPDRNPSRSIVWNRVIPEPTTKAPYISVMLPVDMDGVHVATLGHDIHAVQLLDDSSTSRLQGLTHFIFHRQSGQLIVHRTLMPRIIAGDGRLTLQDSGDGVLARVHRATLAAGGGTFTGTDKAGGVFYAVARLPEPDWCYAATMPLDQLSAKAYASAQWVLWSGLGSLAVLLVAFSFILRRQIARPLAELSRATHEMTAGDLTARAEVRQRDELGALAAAFNDMAAAVAGRDAALERRVAERTADLTDANARLAEAGEEALRSLAREKELGEMKSRFVTTVSHEFRNPLAIILSCSDVLQRLDDKLPPDQRRRQLDGINDAVHRMAGMMEDVLVLGRAEAGRLQCEPRELDLAAFCHRLADQARSATGSRCPIRFHHGPLPAPALADQNLLQHILGNLLTNAVKYSPPGSAVEFTLTAEGPHAVFRISDHGSGIPAADLPRLYEPFHRGSNTSHIPGTGLGLVIVKRCVELHGGTIDCDSTPGEGTVFSVKLNVWS